jgi:hypothetical protein
VSCSTSHGGPGESPAPNHPKPGPYAGLLAKLEEVEDYTHIALRQFPRVERYALCADIRKSLANIQRLAVVAWKRYHKKTTLQDLDVEIEILRMWIRKSYRLRYISDHRYEVWSKHVNEVGRMVGGWIRADRQKFRAAAR